MCVLERGKEWSPGDFPESLYWAASKEIQIHPGGKETIGNTGVQLCFVRFHQFINFTNWVAVHWPQQLLLDL